MVDPSLGSLVERLRQRILERTPDVGLYADTPAPAGLRSMVEDLVPHE